MPKKPKVSKEKLDEIIISIMQAFGHGIPKLQIAKQLRVKFKIADEKQCYKYIRMVEGLVEESISLEHVKLLIKESALKINNVYGRALQEGQLQVALNCLIELNKLLGLYPDKQVVIKKIDDSTVAMTTIENKLNEIMITDMNEKDVTP